MSGVCQELEDQYTATEFAFSGGRAISGKGLLPRDLDGDGTLDLAVVTSGNSSATIAFYDVHRKGSSVQKILMHATQLSPVHASDQQRFAVARDDRMFFFSMKGREINNDLLVAHEIEAEYSTLLNLPWSNGETRLATVSSASGKYSLRVFDKTARDPTYRWQLGELAGTSAAWQAAVLPAGPKDACAAIVIADGNHFSLFRPRQMPCDTWSVKVVDAIRLPDLERAYSASISPNDIHALFSVDLNGDGHTDVVSTLSSGSVLTPRFLAGPTFDSWEPTPRASDVSGFAIAAADVEGDRLPELITCNVKPRSPQMNDPQRQWQACASRTSEEHPDDLGDVMVSMGAEMNVFGTPTNGVALSDANADGKPDLWSWNMAQQSLNVRFSRSSPGWNDEVTSSLTGLPFRAAGVAMDAWPGDELLVALYRDSSRERIDLAYVSDLSSATAITPTTFASELSSIAEVLALPKAQRIGSSGQVALLRAQSGKAQQIVRLGNVDGDVPRSTIAIPCSSKNPLITAISAIEVNRTLWVAATQGAFLATLEVTLPSEDLSGGPVGLAKAKVECTKTDWVSKSPNLRMIPAPRGQTPGWLILSLDHGTTAITETPAHWFTPGQPVVPVLLGPLEGLKLKAFARPDKRDARASDDGSAPIAMVFRRPIENGEMSVLAVMTNHGCPTCFDVRVVSETPGPHSGCDFPALAMREAAEKDCWSLATATCSVDNSTSVQFTEVCRDAEGGWNEKAATPSVCTLGKDVLGKDPAIAWADFAFDGAPELVLTGTASTHLCERATKER